MRYSALGLLRQLTLGGSAVVVVVDVVSAVAIVGGVKIVAVIARTRCICVIAVSFSVHGARASLGAYL